MIVVQHFIRDAAARAYLVEVLTGAGHDVRAEVNGPEPLGADVDLVVADVDFALQRRWIGSAPSAERPPRIVLVSNFSILLEPFAHDCAALVLPADNAAVLAAVGAALALPALRPDARPPPAIPRMSSRAPTRAARSGPAGVRLANAPAVNQPEFVRIAALVSESVHTPMALVTVLDEAQQHFVGQFGLPDDLRLAAGTPRSWSFCQHVQRADATLVVSDTAAHPALAATPLVTLGMIRAYAGVPVHVEGIGVVGTVCALSDQPRDFTRAEIASLELAALLVERQLATAGIRSQTIVLSSGDVADVANVAVNGALAVGDELDGRYTITAALGTGGMSEVYLARETEMGRLVAIKVLTSTAVDDAQLMHEARLLASLRHPNVVEVYGFGRCGSNGGRRYLALEYVRGQLLADRLSGARTSGAPLAVPEVMRVMRNLVGAVETLHGHGITHGDIKPDNVILDDVLHRAVLIDFGIATYVPGPDAAANPSTRGGTPGYSAPEQMIDFAGWKPAPSADVYALAAVAFAMLAGRGPFEHVPHNERIAAQCSMDLPALHDLRPGLAPAVDAVLRRALSLDTDARPGSPTELADALDAALAGVAPAPATLADPASRGSAFARVRRAVCAAWGARVDDAAISTLPAGDRASLSAANAGRGLFPSRLLLAYLRAVRPVGANEHGSQLEQIGVAIGEEALPLTLPLLQIARTPMTLLRAVAPLLSREHGWLRLECAPVALTAATVTLALPPGFAPEFCHIVAGICRAFVAFAVRSVEVRHVRCAADSGGPCMFEIRWS